MEPGKLGAGGNSASEGVLANFFNSLLSNKRADRLSAGGVAGGQASIGNSPGGVAVGASPTGQKPLGGTNDDCKFQNKYVFPVCLKQEKQEKKRESLILFNSSY